MFRYSTLNCEQKEHVLIQVYTHRTRMVRPHLLELRVQRPIITADCSAPNNGPSVCVDNQEILNVFTHPVIMMPGVMGRVGVTVASADDEMLSHWLCGTVERSLYPTG